MRRIVILLLCLSSMAGCHSIGSRTASKRQPGKVTDPARLNSIETMNAAETEARGQMNDW
jgi:uncharacterized protein YceK